MTDVSLSETSHIVIVFDRKLGARIEELARRAYVWIVDSPDNQKHARYFWTKEEAPVRSDSCVSRVTTFAIRPGRSEEAVGLEIARLVDEHHGEFGETPPWQEIEVIGLGLTDALREVFRDLGAESCDITVGGFRVSR